MLARQLFYLGRMWRNQHLARNEVEELQAKKLRRMLRRAYDHVPFYRRLCRQRRVTPTDVQAVADLRKLPVISKNDLRVIYQEATAEPRPREAKLQVRLTSGSTGEPLRLLEDRASRDYAVAFWACSIVLCGLRPWDRVVRVIPIPRAGPGDLRGLKRTLLGWPHHILIKNLEDPTQIEEHTNLMRSLNPKGILAPPSYLRLLARAVQEGHIDGLSPSVILSNGELLDEATRQLVTNALGAKVFEGYGCVEAGGIALECREHQGMHIFLDSVVVELLKDGEPVAPGEEGEVVVTSLWRWPMPVIRYRLGDLATFTDEPCPCGKSLPMMKMIGGRIVDYLMAADRRIVSPHVIMGRIQAMPGVRRYKIIQESRQLVRVLLETEPSQAKELALAIQNTMTGLLGEATEVHVQIVEKIPEAPAEKFRPVISKLTNTT